MKRLPFLFIVTLFWGATPAIGQVQNQFERLRELGEGTKITTYYDLREQNGKTIASIGNPYTLELRYNQFEKLAGFTGIYAKETNQTPPIIGGENYVANHYTAPSFFYLESTLAPGIPTRRTKYLVIVGNVMYELSGLYEEIKPGGEYSLTRYIYQFESNEKGSGGKKKLGAKLKAKMMAMTTEREISKEMQVDHKEVIDAYLKEMISIQEEADNNLTAKEKEEITAISGKKQVRASEGKTANEEFQRKIAAERAAKSGTPEELDESSVYIKNESGKEIHIAHFGGTTAVSAGSTYQCSCAGSVTHATLQGTMWKSNGVIISGKETNCGKIVTIR